MESVTSIAFNKNIKVITVKDLLPFLVATAMLAMFPYVQRNISFGIQAPITQLDESTKQTFDGTFIKFTHPASWNPVTRNPGVGATMEVIELGIPRIISNQVVGFYLIPLEAVKPMDVIYEEEIIVSGQPGYKWIRKGEDYYAYDYYTQGLFPNSVFGIHVMVPYEDPDLEDKLDSLVRSIKFKPQQT